MNRLSIIFILLCFGCASARPVVPARQARAVEQGPLLSVSLSESPEPSTTKRPSMFSIGWHRNWPADDTNVLTAVIRSPDLCLPIDSWELVALTLGETYEEPETNSSMFFAVYNTNLATGERSDYGSKQ